MREMLNIYALYTLDRYGGKDKRVGSIKSAKKEPNLSYLMSRILKTIKDRPPRNSYYLEEAGGCMYLKMKTTKKARYLLCPVCW